MAVNKKPNTDSDSVQETVNITDANLDSSSVNESVVAETATSENTASETAETVVVGNSTEETSNTDSNIPSVQDESQKKPENTSPQQPSESVNKPKPKSKKDTNVYSKSYAKEFEFTSGILEDIFESLTKILVPVFFVLMFIPGLALIAQALFLIDSITLFMISEEWKDEFKNTAKKSVSVEESTFASYQAMSKEQASTKISLAKFELDRQIDSQQKELDSLSSRAATQQTTMNEIIEQKNQILATLASTTSSSSIRPLINQDENQSDQSL